MGVTSAIVLFAVIWFMVLFILLPLGLRTQGDEGKIEPGTHAASPAAFDVRRKLLTVSIVAAFIWAAITGVIVSGAIGVEDFDFFNRLDSSPAGETGG